MERLVCGGDEWATIDLSSNFPQKKKKRKIRKKERKKKEKEKKGIRSRWQNERVREGREKRPPLEGFTDRDAQ